MKSIRQVPTRHLIGVVAGSAVAVTAGGAIAIAAASGGSTPPPKHLDRAVHDALTAKKVAGVSARVHFTNHLVDSSGLGAGGPLLSGADGRLWVASDGRMRLELQSADGSGGDAQAVIDGRRAELYDPSSNTIYRATLPPDRPHKEAAHAPPGIARIDAALRRLSAYAGLSAPQPGNTAGRPSYSVRATPKSSAGLLGAVSVTWDASTGVPLKGSVDARGSSSPVLELEATHITYGPVADSVFSIATPKGAKVMDTGTRSTSKRPRRDSKRSPEVTGVSSVSQAVGFSVAAPDRLAGLRRSAVRLVGGSGHAAALVTYGRGVGAIAVLQSRGSGAAGSSAHKEGQPSLPKVTVDGMPAQELRTALGTVIRFRKGAVAYTVVGSVAPSTAAAAAGGL